MSPVSKAIVLTLALMSLYSNAQVQHGGRLKWPDFNGDGKSDILLTRLPMHWTGLSDGTGVFKSFVASSDRPYGRVLYGDFNGDGNTDVLGLQQTQTHYSLPGLSNGKGGFVFPSTLPDFP